MKKAKRLVSFRIAELLFAPQVTHEPYWTFASC